MNNRLGGDVLYQLNNHSRTQMMGYVLASNNAVIVIDGGTLSDGAALEELLLRLGGKADAWFITHAHFDHVLALTYILERGKINIGTLYFKFPDIGVLVEYERRENRFCMCAEKFLDCVKRSGVNVVTAQKDETIKIGSFDVKVLTDGGRRTENINDSSVVYRVNTRGDSILFLGDLGENEENSLMAEYPDEIRCPIVQMAHHGQGGVSEKFYDFVCPAVCLWSTPQWLWTNRDGTAQYQTLLTRAWVQKYNAVNVTSFDDIAELR